MMVMRETDVNGMNEVTAGVENLNINPRIRRVVSRGIHETGKVNGACKIMNSGQPSQAFQNFVSNQTEPSRKLPARVHFVPSPSDSYNRTPSSTTFLASQDSPASSHSQFSYSNGRCESTDSSQLYSSPDSAYLKNGSSSSDEDISEFIKPGDDEVYGGADLSKVPKELPNLPGEFVSGFFQNLQQPPPHHQISNHQAVIFQTRQPYHNSISTNYQPSFARPQLNFRHPPVCPPVPVDPSLILPPRPIFISPPPYVQPLIPPRPEPVPTRRPGRPRAQPVKKPVKPIAIEPGTKKNADQKYFDPAVDQFQKLNPKEFLKTYPGNSSLFHKVALEEPLKFPSLCQVYIMKQLVRETSFSITHFRDDRERTILFLLVEMKQLTNIKCLFQIANQDCTIMGKKNGESGLTSVFHMAVLYTGADSNILRALIDSVEKRLLSPEKKPQDQVLKLLDHKKRTPLQCLLEEIGHSVHNEKQVNDLIENLKLLLKFGQNPNMIMKDFQYACDFRQDALAFAAALPLAEKLLPLLLEFLPSQIITQFLAKKYCLNKCLLDIVQENCLLSPVEKENLIALLRSKGAISAAGYVAVDLDESSNEDSDLAWLDDIISP